MDEWVWPMQIVQHEECPALEIFCSQQVMDNKIYYVILLDLYSECNA